MSRKRSKGKKQQHATKREAVPEEVLAEGSGPVAGEADVSVLAEAAAAALGDAAAEPVTDDVAVAAEAPAGDDDAHAAVEAASEGDADAPVEAASEGDAEGPVEAASEGDAEAPVEAASEGDAEAPVEAASEGDADGAHVDAVAEAGVDAAASGEVAAADAEEGEAAALPTSGASMDAAALKHLVEALIFASDKPLTIVRLRQLTRVADLKRIEAALAQIAEDYKDRGVMLQSVSGGYQFRTHSRYSTWVQQLIAGKPVRLSRAQLETLAIIAYRQPITRPEIDEIRGVDSSGTLKVLLERSLIRILGKREEVGRPMLYGTTKDFLDFFSLGDLRELPTLREYSELTAESRKVMSDRLGIDPDADLVVDNDPADAPVAAAPAAEEASAEAIEASAEAVEASAEAVETGAEAIEASAEPVEPVEPSVEAVEASAEPDSGDPDVEDVLSADAADKDVADEHDAEDVPAELLASDEPVASDDEPEPPADGE